MNNNGHYYTRDGQPMFYVPKKNGQGTRPTTIADARKLGLLPSVTTCLGVLRKPALERYLVRQAVIAFATSPDIPGETVDQKINRVLDVEKQQDQDAQAAADLGTKVHKALECRLADMPIEVELPEEFQKVIETVVNDIKSYGEVIATEKVIVGKGYAGTADVIVKTGGGPMMILDFKSSRSLPTSDSWPEHKLQLALYAAALHKPDTPVMWVGNYYISTSAPGQWCKFSWANWEQDADIGLLICKIWGWLNKYEIPT